MSFSSDSAFWRWIHEPEAEYLVMDAPFSGLPFQEYGGDNCLSILKLFHGSIGIHFMKAFGEGVFPQGFRRFSTMRSS